MQRALSIYIHIPFCVQKCAYCDFLSAPATQKVQEQYLHMLIKEIKQKASQYADAYSVKTVFIGGGTPTVVPVDLLCRMLQVLKEQFQIVSDAEISMECNPGTTNAENLLQYRQAGVNRLSIGLQSTEDRLLRKLGRIHNYEQFLQTYKDARQAGFTNINIDLMSGLPGQGTEDYKRTLEQVLNLNPEHISAYSLIVEEGTPFYDMDLDLPDEDTERDMYAMAGSVLLDRGYHQYEISNYAKPGYESKHNCVYWERGEYLGLGLGASSLLKTSHMQEIRTKNISQLSAYLEGEFEPEEELILTKREAMEEFFFLGLRQTKGVSLIEFSDLFGEDTLDWFSNAITSSIQDGLLEQEGGRLFLTKKGMDVSNQVFTRFLE